MLGGGSGTVGGGAAAGPSGAQDGGGGGNSEAVATAAASTIFGNMNNNNSGEDDKGTVDDGSGGFGGNRWPRQETLALLKIRSDMESAFRDASVKGPLWDEVSRKLADLGYHRSAKKCKEKFENVYKYHKRTKEGRSGKQDGKTYRFFDQLQALENIGSPSASQPPRPVPTTAATMAAATPLPNPSATVPSSTVLSFAQNTTNAPNLIQSPNPTIQQPLPPPQAPPQMAANVTKPPPIFSQNVSFAAADLMMSNSTSSSTSSDVDLGGRRLKRRRKWKDFFERLTREVTEKQEEMQKKFLEAIEKKEQERMMREDAWKMQEMVRINREREILAQERSMAAAKDAAIMSFLQQLAEKQNYQNTTPQPAPTQHQTMSAAPVPAPAPAPAPQQIIARPSPVPKNNVEAALHGDNEVIQHNSNSNSNSTSLMSPSRWPKVEIEALIKLRTNLDSKYQDNSPKGPLWEEISAAMKRLGYNRNAKRCKEKWENINKYFKKVKESNKKRPEDSKTCPYFHQLDALYRERNRLDGSSSHMKAENVVPLMVQPEQQWPPAASGHENREHNKDLVMEEMDSEDGEDDMEDDEGSDQFEVVASKPVSMGNNAGE